MDAVPLLNNTTSSISIPSINTNNSSELTARQRSVSSKLDSTEFHHHGEASSPVHFSEQSQGKRKIASNHSFKHQVDDECCCNEDGECCCCDEKICIPSIVDPCKKCARCCGLFQRQCIKAKFGILPMVVTTLISIGWFLGAIILFPYMWFYLFPQYSPTEEFSWFSKLLLSWPNFLFNEVIALLEFYMILTNYLKCLYTEPGFVEPDWHLRLTDAQKEEILSVELGPNGKPRFCQQCGTFKPPRAHHSSTDKKCVLKMDHYCVWVNNTVGLNNHKFFYLFLLYLAIGFVHFYAISIFAIVQFVNHYTLFSPIIFIVFVMFAVITLPLACVVFMFCGWQSLLLVTNQTSIEFHTNSELKSKIRRKMGNQVTFKHIYGTNWWDNLKAVLGEDPYYWLLPTPFKGGDGIRFPTIPVGELKKMQEYIQNVPPVDTDSDEEDEDDDDHMVNGGKTLHRQDFDESNV